MGNNMFACCGNNPVNYMDDTGTSIKSTFSYKADFEGGGVKEMVEPVVTPPLYPDSYGGMVGAQIGQMLAEMTKDDLEAISSGEVVYNGKGENMGASISNSYMIKTPWVMRDFVKDNRGNEVSGTTTGVVFEWLVHNVMYWYAASKNNIALMDQAGNLDIQNTIWDDNHQEKTALMLLGYMICCPFSAQIDYNVHRLEWDVHEE